MATITQYAGLSNAELLRQLTDSREFSPVIEELCKRIEKASDEATCPICEGDIAGFLEGQE